MTPAALFLCLWPWPTDPLPPLSDLARFPDRETTGDAYVFLMVRGHWIDAQAPYYPDQCYAAIWQGLREDCARRLEAWLKLDDVYLALDRFHDEAEQPDNRVWYEARARLHLRELRDLIGEGKYRLGLMPPTDPRMVYAPP